ncbi:TFIIB-type zinc ribbon-containing protein [Simplicispira lacusdiani]|uniref:TFIIB-type zinc ribbon-containing protein n=1 Tax=Simplicispira lacusdiani TaxID=2213010 RepID=UPI000E766AB9|nr:zf-TFIIB domain-containing protein [Simplicispira lacusdiani]
MKCPHCPSSTLVITERSGVEIDYCPQCRGVWLDRGELDKLIERSLHEPPPSHGSLGYERTAARRPRKSSWLSDIFD